VSSAAHCHWSQLVLGMWQSSDSRQVAPETVIKTANALRSPHTWRGSGPHRLTQTQYIQLGCPNSKACALRGPQDIDSNHRVFWSPAHSDITPATPGSGMYNDSDSRHSTWNNHRCRPVHFQAPALRTPRPAPGYEPGCPGVVDQRTGSHAGRHGCLKQPPGQAVRAQDDWIN